jgi:hypothetical protein
MKNILELLRNRRIWVSIIALVMFGLTITGHQLDVDQNTLADQLTTVGSALADLTIAVLSVYSFLKPKA